MYSAVRNNLFSLLNTIELHQSHRFTDFSTENQSELLIGFFPTKYTGLVKCAEKAIKVP